VAETRKTQPAAGPATTTSRPCPAGWTLHFPWSECPPSRERGRGLTPTPETDVNRTILLADDDADVLALLGRHFERTGWGVQRALEADGAMSLYERERPDVVCSTSGCRA
jgi:hypothetical protein